MSDPSGLSILQTGAALGDLGLSQSTAAAIAGTALSRATLRPAEGCRVYHEDGRLLDPEGEDVEIDAWWMRRLIDEDVVVDGARPSVVTAAIPPAPRAAKPRKSASPAKDN